MALSPAIGAHNDIDVHAIIHFNDWGRSIGEYQFTRTHRDDRRVDTPARSTSHRVMRCVGNIVKDGGQAIGRGP